MNVTSDTAQCVSTCLFTVFIVTTGVFTGELVALGLHGLPTLLHAPLPLQLARCRLLFRISRVDAATHRQYLRSTISCAKLCAHVCNVSLARAVLLEVPRELQCDKYQSSEMGK